MQPFLTEARFGIQRPMREYVPTPEQAAILAHDSKRSARILAGPGTGKSATVVAFLKRVSEAEPSPRVRLLTFTRAATAELAGKVDGTGSSIIGRPSTIHSFAISVLLQNPGTGGFPEPLRIADEWEHRNVVLETLKRRSGFNVKKLGNLEREMAANWESLSPDDSPGVSAEERARYKGAWEEHRRIYGYTLLAELPYALRRAMEAHDDLQGLDFDLLVVDEYQDLNACDLDVVRRIHARGCSLIAAGDDDQSIYAFRKAHPAGIRRFTGQYLGSLDYSLSVTLRCGKRIVEWANSVIAGDPSRPTQRSLVSPASTSPDGEAAHLHFSGNVSEARGIAQLVAHLRDVEGVDPSDVLVLLRSDDRKRYSKPIRAELENLGISSVNPGEVGEVLEQTDNRRFLALVRLLDHAQDSLAWATLLTAR